MGTGWAVGSSVVLAAALAMGGAWSGGIAFSILILAGACWAFAIARAAYGSRGALLALLAYDVVAVVVAIGALVSRRAGADAGWAALMPVVLAPALVALAALPTAFAIVSEIRSRRGPMQWSTGLALAIPGAVWLALVLAQLAS